MLFKRIESEGLSHYSYLVGDKGKAVVIDPRRDCEVYRREAYAQGFQITDILETHRNEDYVIGSVELAERTGAQIWHADPQLDYQYGESVDDGQAFEIGRLRLEAMHTPGHTPGSRSYLLKDHQGEPWMVFTGDVLFAGDVGRMDLMGEDRLQQMGSWLYESIFDKILPLGDDVIVCPAHGAGSVCGASIAEREWTTVGIERNRNPKLQYDNEEEFIDNVAEMLERPPYFREMERLNIEGAPLLGSLPLPRPMNPREFADRRENSQVLDVRKELGFGGGHVPNALSIWADGVADFAGWFLSYSKPILLVGEGDYTERITRLLIRMGYDDIQGYLSGGMYAWHMAGKDSESVTTITVQDLCSMLDKDRSPWILDVRSDEELKKQGEIPGAHHIHLTMLPQRLDEVARDEKIFIFCGSGVRSATAASLLRQEGWEDLVVISGGTAGWNSIACPLE